MNWSPQILLVYRTPIISPSYQEITTVLPLELEKPTRKVAALSDVMAYTNRHLLESFCASFRVSEAEANMIFDEFKKFIWLCNARDDQRVSIIDDPICIIDEMWHLFILYTKEYTAFCTKYFGRYCHHVPTTEEERRQLAQKRRAGELSYGDYLRAKRERYSMIYDILGKDTFVRWFLQFPDQYPQEKIAQMRLK